MHWLQEILYLSSIRNFQITARHIKGQHNVAPDSLSRITNHFSLTKFLGFRCPEQQCSCDLVCALSYLAAMLVMKVEDKLGDACITFIIITHHPQCEGCVILLSHLILTVPFTGKCVSHNCRYVVDLAEARH